MKKLEVFFFLAYLLSIRVIIFTIFCELVTLGAILWLRN